MVDESLGGSAEEVEVVEESLGGQVMDVTHDPDPEDFDFDAFVSGVRPGRRAVKVTMRADLVAELDHLVHRAEALPADMDPDDRAQAEDALMGEFEAVKARIVGSQRVFVVEARSDHRGRQIAKLMEKEGLPRPGKKASDEDWHEWNNELALRRLADAIVIPSNVTVEGLRKLDQTAEAETAKMYAALNDVNTNPTRPVTPNFSLRR